MNHPLYRVTSVECIQQYSLRLRFNDGLTRTIDFESILEGELYGPLRDPAVFAQVTFDPEIHTVVWPCGADFDPATLHDWPEHEAAFRAAAESRSHSNSELAYFGLFAFPADEDYKEIERGGQLLTHGNAARFPTRSS